MQDRDMQDENSLREMFQQARATDVAAAPGLEAVLGRRQRPRRFMPAFMAASVAGLAIVGLVMAGWLVTFYQPAPPPAEISISEWRSPTAFLLEPPGDVVLYGIPALGRSDTEVFSCDGCF